MIPTTTPLLSRVPILCAAALVTTALLSACAPTPAPTPTPTPAFSSEEEAFAAAEATYRAYNDALNQVDLSDPTTFEGVFDLSSGDFEASDRETLSNLSAEGYAFTGQMAVSSFVGVRSAPPFDRVVATVCVDVSASDVVDRSGQSVTAPTRPDMNPLRVTFVLSAGALLIDRADRTDEATCAA